MFLFTLLLHSPRSPLFPTRRSSDLKLNSKKKGSPSTGWTGGVMSPIMDRDSWWDIRYCPWVESKVSRLDRKSTRLNSSHMSISYAVFCLKKKEDGVADPQRLC